MLLISWQVRKAKEQKKIGSYFYKYERLHIFGRQEGNSVINPLTCLVSLLYSLYSEPELFIIRIPSILQEERNRTKRRRRRGEVGGGGINRRRGRGR